jgi:hypothetical protein
MSLSLDTFPDIFTDREYEKDRMLRAKRANAEPLSDLWSSENMGGERWGRDAESGE